MLDNVVSVRSFLFVLSSLTLGLTPDMGWSQETLLAKQSAPTSSSPKKKAEKDKRPEKVVSKKKTKQRTPAATTKPAGKAPHAKKAQPVAQKGEATPPDLSLSQGISQVGRDISNLGEQVIMRIDRIVKKKSFSFLGDPWTIQGIPIFFPSSRAGFHLGVNIQMNNIRRQDPHVAELQGQVLASENGRFKHFLRMDFMRAFGGNWRVTTRLAFDRDITKRYFGISNETAYDTSFVNNDRTLFENTRTQPSFNIQVLRRFGSYFYIGPILGLKWTKVEAPGGSLLSTEAPLGINGGRTHFLGVAIIDDDNDFEPYPSRGRAHELHLALYHSFLASDYDYFRASYTFRKYWPLHRTLTLAHRTFLEGLVGDVPFYELAATGGQRPTLGFGGNQFLRGYFENQFIGHVKWASGLELRWDPIRFGAARQAFTVGFVPFFDIGRVWVRGQPFKFDPLHASAGWGVRLIWNHRFVLRGDMAVNGQGVDFAVELGNSF